MAGTSGSSVYLLLGTHKGAFIFTSDLRRKRWRVAGPFLKGADVHNMILETRSDPTIYACVNSYWWGPNVHMSKDFGKTWVQSDAGVRFEEGRGYKVERVWCISPGVESEPNVLYVGVDPAALFKSEDGGQSWKEIAGLTDHPTRQKWAPGAGGLMVHSIALDPADGEKMRVGISAAGVFASQDGGRTWEPRNKGVLADFLADKYPEVGQCVHHMESHAAKPDVLYQQNHCGVYRSDDGGKAWIDISTGLPSRFGFPLQIHPREPDTVYVIPEESADFRCPVNGEFAVYRSRDRGENWERLDKGLPNRNAYLNTLRHGMAVDTCDPCGVYVGTRNGHVFYSRDEGDSWELLAEHLPPIFSVECGVV